MKKPILKTLLIALVSLTAVYSHAEPKGWGAGVGVFDGNIGIQARKDFAFGKELQYAVDLQAGIFNQNKWTTRLDADFHYLFRPDAVISFYPLVGVNLAIQSKNNRLGGNIGAGAIYDLNTETSVYLEAKYVSGDWDGFAFTAGIFF